MPSVPRYNPAGTASPSVAPAKFPSVRQDAVAPIEAFGGGGQEVARAGGNLINVSVQLAEREKNSADQLVVLDADKKLSALETELQYGQQGVVNFQGKQVFEMPDKIGENWKKGVEEIQKGLNNDSQRLSFAKMEANRWGSLDGNMQRHFASESKKYDDTLTESYMANEREAAKAGDDNRIAASITNQTAAIIDHAQRNGLPQAWVKLKADEATSKTHVSVLNQYLARGEDLNASGYFKVNKEAISTSDRTTVERALEEGTVRGKSLRMADTIWDKSGGDLGKALKEAAKEEDPRVRDMLEQRLEKKMSVQKSIEAEQRNDLYMQSANIIDKSGRTADPREVIPPDVWTKMSPEQRTALQNRAEDPPNDNHLYLEFRDLPPQQLAGMSRADFETKYWANFDKAHRARAVELWDSAKDAVTKSALDPKLSSTLTFKDRVDNAMKQSGIINASKEKSKYSNREAELYANFEQQAAAAVEHFEMTQLGGKRKATGDEMQKVVDDLIVKKVFVDKEWAIDKEKPVGLLKDDEKGHSYVKLAEIPKTDLNSIQNVIKSKGKVSSTDKVQRAYAAFLIGDRRLFEQIVME